MLLQLVFSKIGNLTSCVMKIVPSRFQYSMVFTQVGFFSTLVDIWQREQRLVGFIVMAQSAKIQPGYIPALWGIVKTTPRQHEHRHVPHTLPITHSYKFYYINKKKIVENKKWVFIGNIYICCSTKHTGRILQFFIRWLPMRSVQCLPEELIQ